MSLNHVVGVRGPYTPIQVSTIHGDFPITSKPFLPLGMSADSQIIGITGTAGITGTMGITGGQNMGVTGSNGGIIVYTKPDISVYSLSLSQTSLLTPSQLNYYNETSFASVVFGGIWAVSPTATVKLTKIGKLVTCTCGPISATSNAASLILSALQSSDYYPVNTFSTVIVIQNNGTFAFGRLEVNASGALQISADASSGNFAGSGASGFLGWSASWEAA